MDFSIPGNTIQSLADYDFQVKQRSTKGSSHLNPFLRLEVIKNIASGFIHCTVCQAENSVCLRNIVSRQMRCLCCIVGRVTGGNISTGFACSVDYDAAGEHTPWVAEWKNSLQSCHFHGPLQTMMRSPPAASVWIANT